MARLHRKKTDYIALCRDFSIKREPKIRREHILWILKKFMQYSAQMLCHGYKVIIPRNLSFIPYYIVSSDFTMIETEARYARSSAIHGVFLTVQCEGKMQDEWKAEFKPSSVLREEMEKYLANADLTYNIIQ